MDSLADLPLESTLTASQQKEPLLTGVSVTMISLAGLFIVTRCYARFVLLRKCFVEDVFVLIAFGLSIAVVVLIDYARRNGAGLHIEELSLHHLAVLSKIGAAQGLLYTVAMALIKLSVTIQMLRLFFQPWHRWALWTLAVIVSGYSAATIIAFCLACKPFEYLWNQDIPGGRCDGIETIWLTNAAFSIATDIAVCILPIPMLSSLTLQRLQKYFLMLIFAVGGFGCIVSGFRLQVFVRGVTSDGPIDNVRDTLLWSIIEMCVGLICASAPALRPILSKAFPEIFGTGSRRQRTPVLNIYSEMSDSNKQPSFGESSVASSIPPPSHGNDKVGLQSILEESRQEPRKGSDVTVGIHSILQEDRPRTYSTQTVGMRSVLQDDYLPAAYNTHKPRTQSLGTSAIYGLPSGEDPYKPRTYSNATVGLHGTVREADEDDYDNHGKQLTVVHEKPNV